MISNFSSCCCCLIKGCYLLKIGSDLTGVLLMLEMCASSCRYFVPTISNMKNGDDTGCAQFVMPGCATISQSKMMVSSRACLDSLCHPLLHIQLSPSIVPPCVNFVIVNPHSVVSIHCSSLCQFCHNQFYYV